MERYRQRVWRLAYQLLRDREEAWDCAQEAFVRAFHSLSSFRGQSAFYTWLFRITVNIATDRQRSRGAQARAFGAERVPEEEWRRTIPDVGSRPGSVGHPGGAAGAHPAGDRFLAAQGAHHYHAE